MVKKKELKKYPVKQLLSKSIIFLLIITFGILYSIISITKYEHFQTGLDLAIYVQTFWFYTHFKLPFVTLFPTYGDLVWADHFTPSLMLLTPFYMIWSDPRMLLILQSFFVVAGAYPIYRFTLEKLQSRFLALSLAFSYLTFFGIQYPVTFDFHVATMAASFLPWILWCMFKKKWVLFTVLCVIASGFKEDMPLYVAALSLYLIVSRKNWKLGSVLLVISAVYAYTVTKYIMPSLTHYAAKTFNLNYFSLKPDYLWSVFFNSPVKIQTVFFSFANMLFLPLFSGFFLILPLTHFFINFSNPEFHGRWGLYLHYRSYLSPLIFFAAILGMSNILQRLPERFNLNLTKIIIGVLLIVYTIGFDVFYHLPLNVLLKKQFYYKESWIADNNEILSKIPQDAYLLTTNSLSPQVSYREHVYFYPQNLDKADYIFLDYREGQPVINYWLSLDEEKKFRANIDYILKKNKYHIYAQKNGAMLLKRNVAN